MREIRVYAPAKLNLYLDVLDKRQDGYHNIETLFEKIDLKDEIIIKEKGKGVRIKVTPSNICPQGKSNIVYKALQGLFKEAKIKLDLEIVIKKEIPVSAGLGGGSSDAASAILAVNKMFSLGVSFDRLLAVASRTGKDVPFFMLKECFAIGRGSGEILEPLDIKSSLAHIIIKPKVSFSTAEMYRILDKYKRLRKRYDIESAVKAVKKGDIGLLRTKCYNIFDEALSFNKRSIIEEAKTLLQTAGAGPGFLSGSGPSVYCIVKDTKEAIEIVKKMPKVKNMGIFVAETWRE